MPVLRQNQFSLEIGQRPGAGFAVRRARFAFRLNPDSDLALGYGPAIGRRGVGRIGWGVDLTRRFNWASAQYGAIEGEITTEEDLTLPPQLMIVMDDRARIPVDKSGRFRIKRAPLGVHRLRVDLSSLPAELGVSRASEEVLVQAHQKATVSFQLQRLGRVTGAIRALHPLTPETLASHPFKGLVLLLSNGQRALTEEDGSYRFDNLPPGDYEVELPKESIPEGYVAVGPLKWPFQIRMGSVVSQADFTLDRAENQIQFQDFPPENDGEPPVKVKVAPAAAQDSPDRGPNEQTSAGTLTDKPAL
jgi:hypothetical protein